MFKRLSIIFIAVLFTSLSSLKAEEPKSPDHICPILIGSEVPEAEVKTSTGKAANLKLQTEGKPSIIIFYRGGWCPFCNGHLSLLQKSHYELIELGYQIIAISPDLPKEIGKSINKMDLSYTLISDSKMNAAKAFGVAFTVDDKTIEKYAKYGIDLEASSGEKHHMLPVPSVFIVNASGKITFSYVNPDYKVRLNSEVLITAAKAALKDQ